MRVVIDGVVYVPSMAQDITVPSAPPPQAFAVGDYVEYVGPEHGGLAPNSVGRIVAVMLRSVAVEFVHSFLDGHNAGGKARDGRGRYFSNNDPYRYEALSSLRLIP